MLMIAGVRPSGEDKSEDLKSKAAEFLKSVMGHGVNLPSAEALILGTLQQPLENMYMLRKGKDEPDKADSMEEWVRQRENKGIWLVQESTIVTRLEVYTVTTYFLGYDASKYLPLHVQQACKAQPITFLSAVTGRPQAKHSSGMGFAVNLKDAKSSHAAIVKHIIECEGPASLWRRLVASVFFWSRRKLYGAKAQERTDPAREATGLWHGNHKADGQGQW